jgi:hypothetical protein
MVQVNLGCANSAVATIAADIIIAAVAMCYQKPTWPSVQAAAVRGHPHVADGPATTGAWESRTTPDPPCVARVTPATLAGDNHLGWMHNLISIPSLKESHGHWSQELPPNLLNCRSYPCYDCPKMLDVRNILPYKQCNIQARKKVLTSK